MLFLWDNSEHGGPLQSLKGQYNILAEATINIGILCNHVIKLSGKNYL